MLAAVCLPGGGDLGRRCWELRKTFPEPGLPQILGEASAAPHPLRDPSLRSPGGLAASFTNRARAEARGNRVGEGDGHAGVRSGLGRD